VPTWRENMWNWHHLLTRMGLLRLWGCRVLVLEWQVASTFQRPADILLTIWKEHSCGVTDRLGCRLMQIHGWTMHRMLQTQAMFVAPLRWLVGANGALFRSCYPLPWCILHTICVPNRRPMTKPAHISLLSTGVLLLVACWRTRLIVGAWRQRNLRRYNSRLDKTTWLDLNQRLDHHLLRASWVCPLLVGTFQVRQLNRMGASKIQIDEQVVG